MRKLDSTATINNVGHLLEGYPFEHLSKLDALQLKLNCDNVLKHMNGDARYLLQFKYIEGGHVDTDDLKHLLNYYWRLDMACLEFAELFGLIELQSFDLVSVS
jgi:hypothetical protein